jgi:hypothetical protein
LDILSFVASLAESFAWPIALISTILVLRKQVVGLVPLLRKLKAGPVEAEFERSVEELSSEAEITALPSSVPNTLESGAARLYKLAEISPRAAVIEAWQSVERAARSAVLNHAGSPPPDMATPLQLQTALMELRLVTPDEFQRFSKLRGLRNRANHSDEFSPSPEAILYFIQLAGSLEHRLSTLAGIEEGDQV